MSTQYRNLFVIFCSTVLIFACSNEPSIKSVTSDKVVIGGPPEKFVTAYDLAKSECDKNTKTAQYIPDSATSLKEVAFNCIGEEEETSATETETSSEEPEQAPAETEEVSPQEN